MQLLQNECGKWVRISYSLLLLTPLKFTYFQAGGGKQECKKKGLQPNPSLHLKTPLSIIIQYCFIYLNLLFLVQIYYFTKYCGLYLITPLVSNSKNMPIPRYPSSSSHLRPRSSPQAHSTKFLYIYRVKKQMHEIPFGCNHFSSFTLDV